MPEKSCPHCGQVFVVPDDGRGVAITCSSCGNVTGQSENSPSIPSAGESPAAKVCLFCRTQVGSGEAQCQCPDCGTAYHEECWTENGGCAVYGCASVPEVEKRTTIETPVSFWGQENKPCPSCSREILAAAVRCRHCGAVFASAQPEDADKFNTRLALEQQLPAMRRRAVWIFVLSVLPCTAPIGGIWGAIWYPLRRRDLAKLPALYPVLCKIGIAVGLGQTFALAVVALIYSATKH